MTPEQVIACYPAGDLDNLAKCEERDRNDHEANLWQLAIDVAQGYIKMPEQK